MRTDQGFYRSITVRVLTLSRVVNESYILVALSEDIAHIAKPLIQLAGQ